MVKYRISHFWLEGLAISMNTIYIPAGYQPILDEYDTQRAIAYI